MKTKKILLIFCAILAFFAGAIWVSEMPIVATLVAFLDTVAGFICGFFFKKISDEDVIKNYEEQYTDRTADFINLQNEVEALKKKTTKAKKTTKVKES